jgi:steroid delta-isomerase-like uncharacterized protein
MASKNVETLRAAHKSWNKRDFQGVVRDSALGLVYTDHGRSLTLNGRDKFREWTEGWAKAFSDGRITNPKYIDAGDIVVTQFTVEGTNDGPFGSLPPSGRRISLPFCEICQLDKKGRVVSGGCYYDQYTLLTQLGHIQPLAAAA